MIQNSEPIDNSPPGSGIILKEIGLESCMFDSEESRLLQARQHMYAGPIRWLVERSGLKEQLYNLYCRALISINRGVLTRSVSGTSAAFRIESREEVSFFESLGGEQAVLTDLLERIEPTDQFLDIGAAVGLFSCFVGNAVTAHPPTAIEPHPGNVRVLRENLDQNDITQQIIEAAVAAEADSTTFEIDPDSIMLHHNDATKSVTVPTVTVDELVESGQIPQPTVVKMDIDGGEYDALRGMEETLKSVRLLYCEIHPGCLAERDIDDESVYDLLEKSGFSLTEVQVEEGLGQIVTTVRAERT